MADGFERVELQSPRQALQEAGAITEVVSLKPGEVQGMEGDLQPVGKVAEVSADDAAALPLPGGTVNPDRLRIDPDAVRFVHAFYDAGKPPRPRDATARGPCSNPASAGACG